MNGTFGRFSPEQIGPQNFTIAGPGRRHNRMGKARIAWGAALLGMGLMGLTIVFGINPVEGSVIPKFLTTNPLGFLLFLVLFVTCMPVWVLVVSVHILLQYPESWLTLLPPMIFLQGFVFFWLGKLLSVRLSKLRQGQRNHRTKS